MSKTGPVTKVDSLPERSDGTLGIQRPTFSEGTWVIASVDFDYDGGKVGYVRKGRLFQLGGFVNDAALVDHRLVVVVNPQPKEKDLESEYSRCGGCGKYYHNEWQRDRCGALHEMTEEEWKAKRRAESLNTFKEHSVRREVIGA